MRWLASLLCAILVAGCGGAQQDLRGAFTPGQVRDDSRVHAFQVASFAHAFSSGHARSWDARLVAVERDALPLLAEMAKSTYRLDLEIVPHRQANKPDTVEYFDASAVLSSRSGEGPRFTLPGAPGTDPDVYERALRPAAEEAKIAPDVLKRGHFALYALATMTGELNAADDAMRRMAFGLLVLKKKLEGGERADYLAPMRPAPRSIEDVDVALRVVAEHLAATARWRSEVLAATALVRVSEAPEGRAALREQIAESRSRAKAWAASHPQPTMADYGVEMKATKLPTPDALLEVLDKDGYITAAVVVAKGVATGSPSATVEGFAKLAPRNSSLRIAGDGLAAAIRGDVMATADAVLELGSRQSDVAPIAERLRRTKAAAEKIGTGIATVKGAAGAPTSLGDAQKRLDAAKQGASNVVQGAGNAGAAVKR